MIKYRYALDSADNLIDINNLERAELTKSTKFYSVDFKDELIPRLGKIKRKHFAHKPNIVIIGNGETYLHALGKKIFYDEYSLCLRNKTPFYLNYSTQKHCDRLQKEFNITCQLDEEKSQYDLTKYFTHILIEKRDNDFIPDILLFNSEKKEKIYIEIAVTHFSSDKKKHSGHRIIEFLISTEEDAQNIIKFKNGDIDNIARYYNFKQHQITKHFCTKGNCCKQFNFFSVTENGKCNLEILKEHEIPITLTKYKSNSTWHTLEPIEHLNKSGVSDIGFDFINYVSRAYRENINVKNCYICRYHAKNKSWNFVEGEPIFCKFKKITCSSNYAANCQFFKVEESYVSPNTNIIKEDSEHK